MKELIRRGRERKMKSVLEENINNEKRKRSEVTLREWERKSGDER